MALPARKRIGKHRDMGAPYAEWMGHRGDPRLMRDQCNGCEAQTRYYCDGCACYYCHGCTLTCERCWADLCPHCVCSHRARCVIAPLPLQICSQLDLGRSRSMGTITVEGVASTELRTPWILGGHWRKDVQSHPHRHAVHIATSGAAILATIQRGHVWSRAIR